MKFTNEKYPFVSMLKTGKYEYVKYLTEVMAILGIDDLSKVEYQYFSNTFKEEANKNYEQLIGLIPYLAPCNGFELLGDGVGRYYSIDPSNPHGLKCIIVKYISSSDVLTRVIELKQTKGIDITSVLEDKKVLKLLGCEVIFYCESIDFDVLKVKPGAKVSVGWNTWGSNGICNTAEQCQEIIAAIGKIFVSLCVLNLFKQTVKTEIQIVGDDTGHKKVFAESKFMSEFPIRIFQYDLSYIRGIIKNFPFAVRGFPRWQVCGEGRKDRKLIFVAPFTKQGYHRKPRKDE